MSGKGDAMNQETKEAAESLAEAHWGYVEHLLKVHGEPDATLRQCEFHYKSAFIHGYKHGVLGT